MPESFKLEVCRRVIHHILVLTKTDERVIAVREHYVIQFERKHFGLLSSWKYKFTPIESLPQEPSTRMEAF